MLVDELAGRRCLIVTTPRGRRQLEMDATLEFLVQNRQNQFVSGVQRNPGIAELQADIQQWRHVNFDTVIAFGGGSAIDSAKVLSVALCEELEMMPLRALLEDPTLYLDVRPKPLYAVPTTAGTGSEATPFATVWDHEHYKKYSLAGASVFPHSAIVDPDLSDGLPEEVTVSTGLDAINQAAESIWNRNLTLISEKFATRALQLGLEALPLLLHNPDDGVSRAAMAECSLLAGMAISQTRTAICHSMSYPITAHYGVPHGLACAFTMPAVLRFNLKVDDGRFGRIAVALNGCNATVDTLLERFDRLHADLQVLQRVKSYVKSLEQLAALRSEMFTPDRSENNLALVDESSLNAIQLEAWYGHQMT